MAVRDMGDVGGWVGGYREYGVCAWVGVGDVGGRGMCGELGGWGLWVWGLLGS